MALDSQTLIANRQDFTNTFTDEYAADQTGNTLFPNTGVISVKGVYISTKASTGYVRLTLDGDTIVTFYPTSGTSTMYVPTYKRSLKGSTVKITSTLGTDGNYFILVNYKVE